MPRVGDKHYPYTAKGQAAAKAAAKRKGVKVSHGKGYNKGGSVSKSRVNLGAGAPKRKTRKKRTAKKMQGGGPAINPNIPNAPSPAALREMTMAAQAQKGRGRPGGPGPGANIQLGAMQGRNQPMPGGVAGGPGGGRRPPIVKPRPPGIKKGGAVASKKGGGAVAKKKRGGSIEKMASGEPIQWQKGRVGQKRKADYMSYVAPGVAKRQLKKQKAAGGPGRRAVRGAGGAKKGGAVKSK